MEYNCVKTDDGITIVINATHLDIGNSVKFRETLGLEAEKSEGNITIDLEIVKYIDSTTLGVLITFLRYLKDEKRILKLANVSKRVKETFRSTKIDSEITFI